MKENDAFVECFETKARVLYNVFYISFHMSHIDTELSLPSGCTLCFAPALLFESMFSCWVSATDKNCVSDDNVSRFCVYFFRFHIGSAYLTERS